MSPFLAWSRADAMVATGANPNPYLVFDLPPLPVGSVIRAAINLSTATGTEQVGLGISPDWNATAPTTSNIGNSSFTGPFPGLVHVVSVVRSRSTMAYTVSTSVAQTSAATSTFDFARMNRAAVFVTLGTAITVAAAFVEVFIPRVYR